MSRFDDELVKEAHNAWQERGLPGSTTPRQMPYDQTTNLNLDGPFGLSSQAPTPMDEVADWVADMPMSRQLDVQDLDAAEDGEIIGGPGSSAVYPEGREMYASTLDDTLYNIYKASREVRDSIDSQSDFDFTNLFTAAASANDFARVASSDQDVIYSVGTIAGLVNEIEDNLIVTSDYKQAYDDLQALEGYLEDINKFSSKDEDKDGEDNEDKDDMEEKMKSEKKDKKKKKKSEKKASKTCSIPDCKGDEKCEMKAKEATNGNQETLQITDVRDLDDSGSHFTKEDVMTPDHVTNVLVPEEVNGEDAGYVNYYNDGSETGKTPQADDDRNPFPYDGTNPALAPYAGTVASVQASREKIFDALQVVERLEKLGMVAEDDRMKHVAKFEQMSDAKLAGFKASLDMLEESGARQPRSQKVASGANRLPEMGRMTTASTVTRQSVQADDWLMTLK